MDTSPYYQPQSIAPILERGAAQQVPLIAGNQGMNQALSAIGNVANAGFDVAKENQKKQSVMAAQQAYSQYLAKVDNGSATQQDHAMGRMAALSLGIAPPDTLGISLKNSEISKNNAQANALNNKPTVKPPNAQDLTPQEMNALRQAATRKNNPLPLSMVSFRGPRAKLMAQSLMSDPNWSPNAGESGLGAAKAGAAAGARLNEGGAAQMTGRTANAANAQLDILQEVSKKFPRSNVQLMNTPIIKFDAQTMPEAQNWIIALNSFRNEYASALMRGHMPQGDAQAEVARSLPENITPAQLTQAIPLLRQELNALVKGQMTRATGQEGNVQPHPQDSAAVQWAKANPNDPRAAKILQLNAQ